MDVLTDCGDAFPEAAAWALEYLKPMERDLFRFQRSGQARRHPETTLEILAKVVGANGQLAFGIVVAVHNEDRNSSRFKRPVSPEKNNPVLKSLQAPS